MHAGFFLDLFFSFFLINKVFLDFTPRGESLIAFKTTQTPLESVLLMCLTSNIAVVQLLYFLPGNSYTLRLKSIWGSKAKMLCCDLIYLEHERQLLMMGYHQLDSTYLQ